MRTALTSVRHKNRYAAPPPEAGNVTELEEYEYVIVGSGAGGGPLAARLAIAGAKVLLIEAGDDQGEAPEQSVPAFYANAAEFAPMKWDFYVRHYEDWERQKEDSKMTWDTPSGERYIGFDPPTGSTPKGILYPRAGTIGGCASHNAMVTLYPFESDWEYIQSLTNDDTWSPRNMRHYFERLERSRYLPSSIIGHGFDGWLTTTVTDLTLVVEDLKLLQTVLSAASAFGKGLLGSLLKTVFGLANILALDPNAYKPGRDQQVGLFQVPIAVTPDSEGRKRNGPRDFVIKTTRAVNSDGSRKYHLDIRTHCLVTRIRTEMKGGDTEPTAVGLEFLDGKSLYRADFRAPMSGSPGKPGSVNATKEVIISAGTFNTPQLLKLSGIGPKEELDKFGIPVVKDAPGVGTNMQDRYEVAVNEKFSGNFSVTEKCTFKNDPEQDPCLKRYQNNKILKGVYGSSGFALSAIQMSTSAKVDQKDSDLFVFGVPAYFIGYQEGFSKIGVADSKHFSWQVLLAHARNHAGTVKLTSTDPRDVPDIVFNSWDSGTTEGGADELDLQAVYEGFLYGRKALRNLLPLVGKHEEVWPGPDAKTEEEIKAYIKRESWGHHASCSCPIGADDDPNAVLDGDFRVRGIKNLRVVDASVFPKIPGYFVITAIYMIAEKAADVILAQNK